MDSTPFATAYHELSDRFIRLLDDLSALKALSSLTFRHPDESGLLNSAMRVLMENHDMERCSIFLLENNRLSCATGLDWHDLLVQADKDPAHCKPRKPMTFRLGQGIIGMAAETGRLQHCHDCQSESRFLPPERRIGNEVIGSLICAPIDVNGRVLGVVNVSHSEPHSFNDTHERLLQVFASFLGQILSNWRYYHEMEQEIQHRTVELQQALSEAEELKRRYHQLSIIDELTNLHNRRFFFSEANTALSVAVRHKQPFSVLMVDLDHFKQVNDTHGHAMGDRILQITAALMKAQVREGDILARFGGEEFALALPNTGAEGAKQMSERILEALRAVHFNAEQGEPVRVTASIGIATCEDETMKQKDDRLEHMLRQADQALYVGKAEGRNRSCAYSDVTFRM